MARFLDALWVVVEWTFISAALYVCWWVVFGQ